MKVRLSQTAGFTLVEIMVVVGIIGLLTPIAIPSIMRARANAQKSTCINNLRQIDAAKQQWATETGQATTAVATSSDINQYMSRAVASLRDVYCPLDPNKSFSTSYTINDLATVPECNLDPATHVLQ
jgi:prepilin-type N-terminal cleavage/methylation domain-containing protein